MALDPLTGVVELMTAATKLATVVIESQPPDVRAELWRIYLEDLKRWRTVFRLDDGS